MRVIAFAPKFNKPGRKDATTVFQPEAMRFVEPHVNSPESDLFRFNNHAGKLAMRNYVIKILMDYKRDDAFLDAVAFFCHGTKRTIQCGFDLSNVDKLARAVVAAGGTINVRRSLTFGPIVALYACDTARDLDRKKRDDMTDKIGGDGGFADCLRDALCRSGAVLCRVVAHTAEGHAGRNPHTRFFEGAGSPTGGVGGLYPVSFKSRLWKKWMAMLRSEFRFEFPFLTQAEIIARLEGR